MSDRSSPSPQSWSNHQSFRNGSEPTEGYEITLYSDAQPPGLLQSHSVGPYEFIPISNRSLSLRQAVVVRSAQFSTAIDWDVNDLRTDEGSFHGGDEGDELAALLSLAFGARVESGGITRNWFIGETPLEGPGWPTLWRQPPELHRTVTSVFPDDVSTLDLEKALPVLRSYFSSSASQATAMVRAARLYQKALWVADADTNQSFLWLVAALEAAAVHHRGLRLTAIEALEEGLPELYEAVSSDPLLLGQVAEAVKDLTKSTKRFISFGMDFHPPAPESRPHEFNQVDWSKMRKHLGKIYEYRSKALHSGVPFPTPMCERPGRLAGVEAYAERPSANGYRAYGAEWRSKDLPMHLHTFAYVARGALLAWVATFGDGDKDRSD
jgi:hypothetical protein